MVVLAIPSIRSELWPPRGDSNQSMTVAVPKRRSITVRAIAVSVHAVQHLEHLLGICERIRYVLAKACD